MQIITFTIIELFKVSNNITYFMLSRGGSRVWKGGVHFVKKVEDQKIIIKKEKQNE